MTTDQINRSYKNMIIARHQAASAQRALNSKLDELFPGQSSAAYRAGRLACRLHKSHDEIQMARSIEDCPYPEQRRDGSVHPQGRDWRRGWRDFDNGIPDPTGLSKE